MKRQRRQGPVRAGSRLRGVRSVSGLLGLVALLVLLIPGPAAGIAPEDETAPDGEAPPGDESAPADETAPDGFEQRIQILGLDQADGMITLEIAVPPSIGRLAPVANNFAVADGESLVDLTVQPLGTAATTVMVIDTSGSMRGSALEAAKTAARSFVEELPDNARVGLVSFGDEVVIHREPTSDRAELLAELDRLEAAGNETVLWDGLLVASDLVADAAGGHTSVVVLSDGDDTDSEAVPSDVVDRFGDGSAVLYAVAIESPDTDLLALERTVEAIDGQFLATTNVAQLDSLYTDIAGRLANRYRIRFEPVEQGTRSVVVSVAADGTVATARITIEGSDPADSDGGAGPAEDQGQGSGFDLGDRPVLGTVAAPRPGPMADPVMFWLGLGAMFAAFALVAFIVARPPAQVRLDAAAGADRLGGINARLGQAADRLIADHDSGRRFDNRLEAADINLRPGEFAVAWGLVTGVTMLSLWALAGLLYGLMVIPVSLLGVLLLLGRRAGRRREKFGDQLTETLGIMASSLRAGQSLPKAIELVAAEAPSPTAEQFHRIAFEIRVGRDMTESIRQTSRRMASPDLEWLAQAVDINRELGGDLTEILDNVAATIRERRTVARQIDALSSEGRATGWVLLGMPIAMFLFAWWRTPENIEAMVTQPLGRILLAFAVTGMVVGQVWIRQMVKLKF